MIIIVIVVLTLILLLEVSDELFTYLRMRQCSLKKLEQRVTELERRSND